MAVRRERIALSSVATWPEKEVRCPSSSPRGWDCVCEESGAFEVPARLLSEYVFSGETCDSEEDGGGS
jgi:hypothetical protein